MQPPASPRDTPAPREAADVDERKHAVAWSMWYLLLGIVILGLLLLAIVIIWGRRVRGIARKPYPAQHRGDRFWYLRTGETEADTARRPTDRSPPGAAPDSAEGETPSP